MAHGPVMWPQYSDVHLPCLGTFHSRISMHFTKIGGHVV